jgi:hypothetical protein
MGISSSHLIHFFRNFLGASRTLRGFFSAFMRSSKEEIRSENATPSAGKGMTPRSAIALADRPKNSKKKLIDQKIAKRIGLTTQEGETHLHVSRCSDCHNI